MMSNFASQSLLTNLICVSTFFVLLARCGNPRKSSEDDIYMSRKVGLKLSVEVSKFMICIPWWFLNFTWHAGVID